MKIFKIALSFLMLVCILLTTGCGYAGFSKQSEYKDLSNGDDITISVKEGSVTDSGLVLLIRNNTKNEYTYGMDYSIEKKKSDTWYTMDGEYIVNSLAAILAPESTNEFRVTWEKKLGNGTYRVIKPVSLSDSSAVAGAEFEIG